jgi:hypothetical protein
VDADPAGPALDGLGDIVGPVVGELGGVDLDRRRVLAEDGGAELAGQLRALPGEGRPGLAGRHGADLGELAVALSLHGVGRFAFGRDMGLILGQLVGGGVSALSGGAGQDFIGGAASGGPLLPELVEQVGQRSHQHFPSRR